MKIKTKIVTKLKKAWPFVFVVTCSFLLAGILSLLFPALFDIGEAQLIDQLFRLRYTLFHREAISQYLIHVVFDDESYASLESSPWDRQVYGEIMEILKQAGAGYIACDIFFQYRKDGSGDEFFIDAVKQARNVYFPVVAYEMPFSLPGKEGIPSRVALSVIKESLFYPVMKKKGNPFTSEYILTPFDELFEYSAGTGHINCSPDIDGINRTFPLIYQYNDGFLPALTLKMVCDYLGVDASNIEITFGKSIVLKHARLTGNRIRDITIPVDTRGRVVINYVGPREDTFYEIFVKSLLASRDDVMLQNQLEDTFEGSLVLISDTSVRNKDVGPGIFNSLIPYSDILITLTNMVMTENFLRPLSGVHFFIIIFIFALLLVYSLSFHRLSLFLLGSFISGRIWPTALVSRYTYLPCVSGRVTSNFFLIIFYTKLQGKWGETYQLIPRILFCY
ncbi:MAG: CHASE2 domain-containing protein [Spirochaetales bacterium]|nr:CHASE2 domain-containing protein [Spirochaetales bacterium]